MDPHDEGIVVGLLIGEGHFGGDGRQPQVTLRMHVRHEALMRWLAARFPRSRLYGPYHHGGRHYFQWMARGEALVERPAAAARAPHHARARRPRPRAAHRDDRRLRRGDRAAARPRRAGGVKRLEELGRRYGVPPAGIERAGSDPRASGRGSRRADHGVGPGRRRPTATWPTRSWPSTCPPSATRGGSPTSAPAPAGRAWRWPRRCPTRGWRWWRARSGTAATSSGRWPPAGSRTRRWFTRARRSGPTV